MQQVLFHLPFTEGLAPPDGFPLYGFGAMLFLCFLLTAMIWGPLRSKKVGVSRERLQDMAIVLFLAGIAGARLVYMWQYHREFGDKKTTLQLVQAFFEIWNGGIVLYGSLFGALIGYILFYRLVLRKYNINTWKLFDAIAPLMALGLAVGRIGCYLNGCCWGQVACEECQTVPLSAELGKFPLLTAHSRNQVVLPATPEDRMPSIFGLQTSTGFTTAGFAGSGGRLLMSDTVPDPRVVVAVERGSEAEAAGLKPGDRIVKFNGSANRIYAEFRAEGEALTRVLEIAKQGSGEPGNDPDRPGLVYFKSVDEIKTLATVSRPGLGQADWITLTDDLWNAVKNWPRGKKTLALEVQRNGETISISYAPRTITFFPTQLYETVSMILLIFLLLAFQPFRRHNGQMMVVFLLGYACHRFLNEAIRIEPTYMLGLTLSQWISVGIITVGIGLEIYLRLTQPKLPSGMQPLGA